MASDHPTSSYRQLNQQLTPAIPDPTPIGSENELDHLLDGLKKRQAEAVDGTDAGPLQRLRNLTLQELVPIFVELVEKYSGSGISMQMDASNFLEGGREIKLEFAFNGYRIQMNGTVTTEAIAFHETRYSPNMNGELLSGPMLRLRGLTKEVFRQFICERLTLLIRNATRGR